MTKKYTLTRNDDLVCENVTLEQAVQICTHFNHPHDHFRIMNGDDVLFAFDRERKVFKLYQDKH